MDPDKYHQLLSTHFSAAGKTQKTLQDDIDAFSTPDMEPVLDSTFPHFLNALSFAKHAFNSHSVGEYNLASHHLVNMHNQFIKMANIVHTNYPDTPLAMSYLGRVQSMGEHVNKYAQLAAEGNEGK